MASSPLLTSKLMYSLYPVQKVSMEFIIACANFCPESDKPCVYFLALIDVLTNYGGRKRAAHAAKTMKHGVKN